jgi:hypothetical protein
MKLLRIWLFGVPFAVASIVALGAISHRVATYTQDSHARCSLDRQVNGMSSTIADQRDGVSCKARAVQ